MRVSFANLDSPTATSTFRVPSDFEDDDSDIDISEDEGDARNEDRDEHTPVESPEVQEMKVWSTPAMIDLTGKDDEVGEVAYHEKENCHSNALKEFHPDDAKVLDATPESDDESIDSSDLEDGGDDVPDQYIGDDAPDQYIGDDADDSDVPSEQPICRGTSTNLREEVGRDSSEEPLNRPDATDEEDSCALDSDEYDGASLWSDLDEENNGRDVFISEALQATDMSKQQQEIDQKDAEPSQPEPTKIGAEDRYPTPERLVPQLFVKQPSFADEMDQELSVAPSRILSMPNPSDAAMAKSLTPQASSSEAIFELSEKSNKHEFFAARAENRARLQFGQPIRLCSDIDDFFQGPSFTEDIVPLKQAPSGASQMSERRSIMLADYLFGPDHAGRPASPDLDMTSAATFAQSKAAHASHKPSSPAQQNRRSVTIKDIVEDAEAVVPEQPQSLKRKVADISDLVEGEMDLWSQKEMQDVTEVIQLSDDLESAESVREETEERVVDVDDMAEVVAEVPEVIIQIPVPAKQTMESRPSKKLKRFAEAVGYAALGGVVAGAGLFAALVSTAPDF
jgi:hypothetical protein